MKEEDDGWEGKFAVKGGLGSEKFRSELKNDYRRWFKGTLERAQSEAKISNEVVKRGLAKGLGKEENAVKGGLGRMGEEKFKRGTI